ncbi:Protein of unknown function [Thermobacillus xylanilyticus]|uniref:Uncharacterized protein n=1 Tax=Thermobacillus xylanilyticus TaxID=76633 RepID=A0ABN7RG59_THEXY|nr:Protein of unknown function [Thermobacillus xylanilyticus]
MTKSIQQVDAEDFSQGRVWTRPFFVPVREITSVSGETLAAVVQEVLRFVQ